MTAEVMDVHDVGPFVAEEVLEVTLDGPVPHCVPPEGIARLEVIRHEADAYSGVDPLGGFSVSEKGLRRAGIDGDVMALALAHDEPVRVELRSGVLERRPAVDDVCDTWARPQRARPG
jgi:hypothetical protein